MAALLKPRGFTYRLLLIRLSRSPLYVPSVAWEELARYMEYIKEKLLRKGIDPSILDRIMRLLRRVIKTQDVSDKLLKYSTDLVRDPKDAPFVALALHLVKRYQNVTIITFNVRDFDANKLIKMNIRVALPEEI